MTKTVIEMARETGARPQQNKNCDVEYLMSAQSLERFAELVRMQERESCAMQCIEIGGMGDGYDCAAEIRK